MSISDTVPVVGSLLSTGTLSPMPVFLSSLRVMSMGCIDLSPRAVILAVQDAVGKPFTSEYKASVSNIHSTITSSQKSGVKSMRGSQRKTENCRKRYQHTTNTDLKPRQKESYEAREIIAWRNVLASQSYSGYN